MSNSPHLTKEAVELIKLFEGLRLDSYLCSSKIPTIGYGATFYENGKRVRLGEKITEERANELLAFHLKFFDKDVRSLIKVPLTDNQFSALVSFAFNVGSDIDQDTIPEGLGDSRLLRLVNENPDNPLIRNEFMKWINSRGKPSKGLIKRRKIEADLYFKK